MVHPSWLEIALLAILLCISGSLFWLRFRKPVDAIRRSRDNPDFKLRPLGAAHPPIRLGSAAARQSDSRAAAARPGARIRLLGILRVRAGHPQPFRGGVRHARSLAATTRFRTLLFRLCGRVRGGGGGVDRRPGSSAASWCGPKWLGKVSPESGVIALLIFMLMVTYLAGLVAATRPPRRRA